MKLSANIAGQQHQVDVKRDGSRVFATVDGRAYELQLTRSDRGAHVLLSSGIVYDCRVFRAGTRSETLDVLVGSDAFAVTLTDPKRLRGSQLVSELGDGVAKLAAPMPGKVVRLLVEVGTKVEAGTGIVIVEAMKMQNELKAPKDGTVTAINVSENQTVNAGDVLAVIE